MPQPLKNLIILIDSGVLISREEVAKNLGIAMDDEFIRSMMTVEDKLDRAMEESCTPPTCATTKTSK